MPSLKEYDMNRNVMDGKGTISETAKLFAVSPSTVRRAMDKVTDFENEKFTLELNGAEVRTILGWLRNGNWSACDLADSIEERI